MKEIERVEWVEKGRKERIGKVDSLVRARERERVYVVLWKG